MIHSGYDKTRSHRRPLACTLEMQVFQLQGKRELGGRCVSMVCTACGLLPPNLFFSSLSRFDLPRKNSELHIQLTSNLHDMQLVANF